MPWSLRIAAPLLVLGLLAAGVWGYGVRERRAGRAEVRAEWAAANERAAEQAREVERTAEKANRGIADALSDANRRAASAGRLAADRLRALSRSEAAAACSRLDAPAASIVPERTGVDLVALAERADDTARQLAACQTYIHEVVKP
jgi:hypothetical protein